MVKTEIETAALANYKYKLDTETKGSTVFRDPKPKITTLYANNNIIIVK